MPCKKFVKFHKRLVALLIKVENYALIPLLHLKLYLGGKNEENFN